MTDAQLDRSDSSRPPAEPVILSPAAEEKLWTASKGAAVLTLFGVLLVGGSLIYGAITLRDAQARKNQLESEVANKVSQLSELSEGANELSERTMELEMTIAKKNEEATVKAAEIDKLTKQQSALQQHEITDFRKQIDDLREQINESKKQLLALNVSSNSQLVISNIFTQLIYRRLNT
jgi:tRNA A37 N6-isopentenylltransferase MiaA